MCVIAECLGRLLGVKDPDAVAVVAQRGQRVGKVRVARDEDKGEASVGVLERKSEHVNHEAVVCSLLAVLLGCVDALDGQILHPHPVRLGCVEALEAGDAAVVALHLCAHADKDVTNVGARGDVGILIVPVNAKAAAVVRILCQW